MLFVACSGVVFILSALDIIVLDIILLSLRDEIVVVYGIRSTQCADLAEVLDPSFPATMQYCTSRDHECIAAAAAAAVPFSLHMNQA